MLASGSGQLEGLVEAGHELLVTPVEIFEGGGQGAVIELAPLPLRLDDRALAVVPGLSVEVVGHASISRSSGDDSTAETCEAHATEVTT